MTITQQGDIITAGLILGGTLDAIAGLWFAYAILLWAGRKIRSICL